jgi:hypothetical protein
MGHGGYLDGHGKLGRVVCSGGYFAGHEAFRPGTETAT